DQWLRVLLRGAWTAADRVENPDPLGFHDSNRIFGHAPQRTFRYGMPSYDRPRLTFRVSRNPTTLGRTPNGQALEVAMGLSWVCWGGGRTWPTKPGISFPTLKG